MIVLETDRLILRKMKAEDHLLLEEIFCDPAAMKYYPAVYTSEEVKWWIDHNLKSYESNGYGLWIVIRKSDNVFLGDCGITSQNIEGEILPELGYHILPRFQGNGYASEAAKGCMDYAFETLQLTRLYTYTDIHNKPSARVAEKNGMKYIRNFRKVIMGTEVEEILFSISKEEWNLSGS